MLRLIPPLILLAVTAFFAAYTSRDMRQTSVYWPYLIAGTVTLFTWIWIVRVSPYNLTVTSVIWDVVYNGIWIATMIFVLHEVTGWTQAVGAGVVILGLVLMGL